MRFGVLARGVPGEIDISWRGWGDCWALINFSFGANSPEVIAARRCAVQNQKNWKSVSEVFFSFHNVFVEIVRSDSSIIGKVVT